MTKSRGKTRYKFLRKEQQCKNKTRATHPFTSPLERGMLGLRPVKGCVDDVLKNIENWITKNV
jgi:hypothetical protein